MAAASEKVRYTADQLLSWLPRVFPSPSYVVLPGVRDATGWSGNRRSDVMVMSVWPSTGLELQGFEIKVSRSDWLRELKDPWKADPIARFCDRWWLLVPEPGIIHPGEVPDGWGVMLLNEKTSKQIVKAPQRTAEPITRQFLASLLQAAVTHHVPPPKAIDINSAEYTKEQLDAAIDKSRATLIGLRTRLKTALTVVERADYMAERYELTLKSRDRETGDVTEEPLG